MRQRQRRAGGSGGRWRQVLAEADEGRAAEAGQLRAAAEAGSGGVTLRVEGGGGRQRQRGLAVRRG